MLRAWHQSFDIHLSTSFFCVFRHAKQTRTETHQSHASAHFFGNESQVQKVMLVGCDWWISILVCLACRKTVSGDVCRTKAAMHVTLKVGVR